MYKLNSDGIKTFRTFETLNFVVYVLLVLIIILLRAFGDYYWVNNKKFVLEHYSIQYYLIMLTDLIPACLISVIFLALLYQLKHYHNYEYMRLRKSIFTFYFVEVALIMYVIISNQTIVGSKYDNVNSFENLLLFIGIFPL